MMEALAKCPPAKEMLLVLWEGAVGLARDAMRAAATWREPVESKV